jgi:hypothetical protein
MPLAFSDTRVPMAPVTDSGAERYFPPFRDPSVFYRELDFAQRTRWADFLDAYLGAPKRVEA